MLSRRHRIYRTSVSRRLNSRLKIGGKNVSGRDENMHRFEKLLLTVLAVWLEEERGSVCQKISDFYTLLQSNFVLKNGSLKEKRKKCITFLCCVIDHFVWCLSVRH